MRTINQFRRLAGASVVTAALAAFPVVAPAEDIDIFGSPSGAGGIPNVLIVLDSSANWSSSLPVPNCYYKDAGVTTTDGPKATSPDREQGTKMAIEKCALYNVVDALPTHADGSALVAVGLMLFNESPASNSGGYPRKAIVPLTAANKLLLKAAIRGITIGGDKGNNAAFAKSLYEAFLYLSGRVPYRGTAGTKWDRAAVVNGRYAITAGHGCARDTIIFIANGGPGEVTNNEAKALLQAERANVTPISYPTSVVSNSDQANWADEMARYFRNADVNSSIEGTQAVTTHAIAVTGASSDGNYPNFIKGIATAGGGTFRTANNVDALVDGITAVFNQVIAANTVFASASLPISVNARGTYKNQIFMGMLRPDAKPRWAGNLKQYRFAFDPGTDTLEIVDSAGNTAISAATGFIDPGAISYWTSSSSFWVNAPSGTPASGSDSPDGEIVEKGGAAQRLRTLYATTQAARAVYTCIGCGNSTRDLVDRSDTQFEVANGAIRTEHFGVTTAAERDALIAWARGTDNAGDEKGPGGTTTVRPSIHGDVLHSRPAVITYGSRVVVFYGANDGMLHAVEGTQDSPTGGTPLWGFVPEESLPKLKRLRDNTPDVRFPTTPSSVTSRTRDYFVDGNVSVYQKADAQGTVQKAVIFFGMRRGGRAVYAIDVTDPDRPTFLWRKTPNEISVLGQTWSEPKVARLKNYPRPVIVMGAGYDTTEDLETPGTPTMGNAVLVLDSTTGDVVRQFGGVERPVPADLSLIDTDFDGYVDRAYAVDLGGNVYRLDFEPVANAEPNQWTIGTFASLGSSGGRKFFFPPDVVLTREYAVVLVGSGDREKPLKTTSSDYFYTVLDRNVGKAVPSGTRTITFADLVDRPSYSPLASSAGCSLRLSTAGEKVVNAPVTVAGATYFSTNQPTPASATSCSSNLGLAKSYSVPLLCGTPKVTEILGGGLPPSPVAGVVEVQVADPAGGDGAVRTRLVPFIIGGDNTKRSAIEGSKVQPPIRPRRSKLYWFFDRDR